MNAITRRPVAILNMVKNNGSDVDDTDAGAWMTFVVVIAILCLISLIGGGVIFYLMSVKFHRKSFSVYLRYMVVADFLMCFTMLLDNLDDYLESVTDKQKYIVTKSVLNCVVFDNSTDIICGSAVWFLTMFVIDRYITASKSPRRQNWCTARRAIFMCSVIALITTVIIFISDLTNIENIVKTFHSDSGDCVIEESSAFKGYDGFYQIFLINLLPMAISFVFSLKILLALKYKPEFTEESDIVSSENVILEKRTALLAYRIGLAYFILSWPYLLVTIVEDAIEDMNEHVSRIADVIYLINFSCKVFLVYGFRMGFKHEIREMFTAKHERIEGAPI